MARWSPLAGRWDGELPTLTIPGGPSVVEARRRRAVLSGSSRGPTLPVLPPGGDEAPVVVVGVHAGRAVADDADLDAPSVRQDAQLLQFLKHFQRVRRQVGER